MGNPTGRNHWLVDMPFVFLTHCGHQGWFIPASSDSLQVSMAVGPSSAERPAVRPADPGCHDFQRRHRRLRARGPPLRGGPWSAKAVQGMGSCGPSTGAVKPPWGSTFLRTWLSPVAGWVSNGQYCFHGLKFWKPLETTNLGGFPGSLHWPKPLADAIGSVADPAGHEAALDQHLWR